MTFWTWSRTAASNSNADGTINFAEGQAPSSLNDSARAMMAAAAKYRDDISGAIATGGTSAAYTLTSYQVFDTAAHMNGKLIAFTPHATSAAAPTINVDGLGNAYLRASPGVDLPAGVLIQGTPYMATFNNSDGAFYLHSFYGNPYQMPIGGGMDYWGSTAPNSAFVFPYGQAISRTTYATLFNLMGITHGPGDGGTTFNLPDLRGRVVAGADAMGGIAANRLTVTYFGAAGLGSFGGVESQALSASNLPAITPTFTGTPATINSTSTPTNVIQGTITGQIFGGTGPGSFQAANNGSGTSTAIASTASYTPAGSVSSFGGGIAHNNVQPTICSNYILRVI